MGAGASTYIPAGRPVEWVIGRPMTVVNFFLPEALLQAAAEGMGKTYRELLSGKDWLGLRDGHLASMASASALGDPLDATTQIGPIATKSEYDKILTYIESGKQSGAKLAAGGGTRKINGKGLFIEPTLFANATNDMKISREEIFGPVLPIIPFEGEEEAIRLANDTTYGLASGIQTGDIRRALRLADKIKAGTVWLNTWHKYHPNAPFGGYKMSGYGREQGCEALENYTQYKTVWANLA